MKVVPLKKQKIGVIGAGKMGQALIRGLLAQGSSPKSISASDSDRKARRAAASALKIAVCKDNAAVVGRSSVILLAVKPQQFPELIDAIAPQVSSRHLVISIAAGIRLDWLQKHLPRAAVVRVMPNLPATVGCGFSALAFGRRVTAPQKKVATAIFSAVGEVVALSERYFDAVTAVSGSGPAYVFWLVKAWQEAAVALGLPASIAKAAVYSTLRGSERLLARKADASALIKRVASKGGTTEAALKVLEKRRTQAYFIEALRAAAARSRQLSRG